MNKKRLISLLLAFAMAATLLAGCTGQKNSVEKEKENENEQTG